MRGHMGNRGNIGKKRRKTYGLWVGAGLNRKVRSNACIILSETWMKNPCTETQSRAGSD